MNRPLEIIELQASAAVVILRVDGRLDAQGTAVLRGHATSVSGRGRSLIINLDRVEFIASSAIGALLVIVEEFNDRGLKVRFACTSNLVRTAVELMNLDDHVEFDDTEEQAVRALAA